jgi:hypothetical protein
MIFTAHPVTFRRYWGNGLQFGLFAGDAHQSELAPVGMENYLSNTKRNWAFEVPELRGAFDQ